MKDFNDFFDFMSENKNKITYDLAFNLEDVPESQRTITKDEWTFIQTFTINAVTVILRYYHDWLNQETDE